MGVFLQSFDFDIGIIGAGSAGLSIAAGAARFGAKTLLIEKERMGGDCLHYGCVPSKTLIRTAQVRHLVLNSSSFGLPASTTRPLDFTLVRDRIRSVIKEIEFNDSPERFRDLGVCVEFGAPEFMDEHTVMLGSRRLSAKNWVITTGSSPAIPNIEGLAVTPYLTNRDIFYMDRLPGSMIMLGGGPIAIEMAQAFARLGSEVTVVQRAAQILEREDRDMAEALMKRLAAEGVRFYLNSEVIRVRENSGRREVTIKAPQAAEQTIISDELLVAAGRVPNLQGLGLEKIGVEYDSRGLKLDERLRTTCRHIYGAGDVTGSYLFTHAAGYEGSIVLSNAILHLPRRVDYKYLPWCTYTDPELASIGMNEQRAQQAGISYHVITEPFSSNDRAHAEAAAEGMLKLVLDKRERPVGVQILGPHAGELISEWVAFFNGGSKLYSLAGAVHPYPTLSEINKRAAGNVIGEKLFSDRVKKLLKLFFGLRGR